MSDQAVVILGSIAGSLLSLIGTMFTVYMTFKMAQLKRDQEAAVVRQDEKLDGVSMKVDNVHTLANSMKDQLVKVTEKEALARGGIEERERADLRTEKAHELGIKEAVVAKAMELKADIAQVPEKTAALVKEPEEPNKEKV